MCLPLAVFAGIYVNRFSIRRYKKSWQQVLVVVLGFVAVMTVMDVLAKLTILQPKPGPYGLGEGLAVGIGMGLMYALLMILGALLYILSTVGTSVIRVIRRKSIKSG